MVEKNNNASSRQTNGLGDQDTNISQNAPIGLTQSTTSTNCFSVEIASDENEIEMFGTVFISFLLYCSISRSSIHSSSVGQSLSENKPNSQKRSTAVLTDAITDEAPINSLSVRFSAQSLIPEKRRRIEFISQTFLSKEIATELTSNDIDLLFKHFQEAIEERDALLAKISTVVIDYDFLRDNNKKTLFYTGLPTWSLLNNLFETIKNYHPITSTTNCHNFECLC